MSEQNNQPKEIDLLELFRIIGQGIRNGILNLFKSILFLIVFGVKRIHWLSIFVAAGCVVGFIFSSNTERYYTSEVVIRPHGITSFEASEFINNLKDFTNTGNVRALSFALSLPDSVSRKIKSIEAFYYLDVNKDKIGDFVDYKYTYDPVDTNRVIDNNRLLVQIQVYDNTAFTAAKQGILRYIENDTYLHKLNQIWQQETKELISITEKEIIKLDSLQNVDYFKKGNIASPINEGKLMFLSESEKQMYYIDKKKLVKQKQEFEKALALATGSVTIIRDLNIYVSPENPPSGYLLKFGFWFGVIGYLFFIVLKYKEKIQSFIQ